MAEKDDFLPPPGEVTMFSTTWCGYCRRLKQQLSDIKINEINIEENADAAAVVQGINDGNQTVPVVLFADRTAMTNPPAAEVKKKCAELSSSPSAE